jgi:hypothetical protein
MHIHTAYQKETEGFEAQEQVSNADPKSARLGVSPFSLCHETTYMLIAVKETKKLFGV